MQFSGKLVNKNNTLFRKVVTKRFIIHRALLHNVQKKYYNVFWNIKTKFSSPTSFAIWVDELISFKRNVLDSILLFFNRKIESIMQLLPH